MRASVHRTGLRLQRVQPADDAAAGRHAIDAGGLEADRPRLDIFDRDGVPRPVRGDLRTLGRGRRAAQGDVHRRRMLGERVPDLGARRLPAQSLDHLSRLRRHRRLRARHRLHLAGLDADEMVSRSSGHGHRHGDHGIRRRRLDRLAAVGLADGQVRQFIRRRRALHLHHARLRVLRVHDGRLADRARAGAGLEAGGLRSAGRRQQADDEERRLRLSGGQDAAVLADLDRAVLQYDRGHRRARPGLRDEPGNVPRPHHRGSCRRSRRPDEPVQHGRPLQLGLAVGLSSDARTPTSST